MNLEIIVKMLHKSKILNEVIKGINVIHISMFKCIMFSYKKFRLLFHIK